MALKVTWRQALAWRMRRHLLDPAGTLPVAGVVDRLCGVQAQVASSAELAIRVRHESSRPGEVGGALSDGRLIKTWAMRGALHLVTPEQGGTFLAVMGAAGQWERWRRYFGATTGQMDALGDAIREALDGAPMTRVELAEAVLTRPGLGHAAEALRESWGGILKPLAWQGDLCFGPSRGGSVTFTRPSSASSRWTGLRDRDEAALLAIAAYLGTYGPATTANLRRWLGQGTIGGRHLRIWFGALGDRLAEVEVDGDRAYVLAEHVDDLASTRPTTAVRLLPGFDQWVLGPGTEDGHVTPAGRRAAVSRQAGWISPVVVAGGVVCGTWELDGDEARVTWFEEAGSLPRSALEGEVASISSILGRDLRLAINPA